MKTGNLVLKSLLVGAVIVSAANFSNEALAVTPLTTDGKNTLSGSSGTTLRNNVTAMLAAAPAADREQLAKDIVAYIAGKPGASRDDVRVALKAATSAVPGKAAGIAVAAAQAAVAGNPNNQTALVLAVAMGAAEGAPTELVGIRDALFAAVPSISRPAIEAALNAGVQQTTQNPTQTTTENPTLKSPA